MRKNEIKRTIEEVVRVEYIAEDGTVFRNEEECKKYEESAKFTILTRLKKLNPETKSIYSLFGEGSEEDDIDIFDIQTEEDLELLRRYIYLELSEHGAKPKDGDIVIPKATCGHEVIIFWWYDHDGCYTRGDGSLEGIFENIRENYKNCFKTWTQIKAEREAKTKENN